MNIAKKTALAVTAAGLAAASTASSAEAVAVKSPGVGSGNIGSVPVHVPVNVVGITGNLIGALNPTFASVG